MRQPLWRAARAAMFRAAEAERAHELALGALARGLVPAPLRHDLPRLRTSVLGLDLPHPVGLAAGFDKDAVAPDALLRLGFAFVEVGTLTPRAQPGNPRPRMFRLAEDHALVNRLGFNNGGHEPARARLAARRGRPGVVGVNVGANKDADDRVDDYVRGIETLALSADYVTVNISSPNTPGLRDLQHGQALSELLGAVTAARDRVALESGRRAPVLLKIAPDVDDAQLAEITDRALAGRVDGMVVGNTTVERDAGLRSRAAGEQGGLSGAPLRDHATAVLARVRLLAGPELPLVGVGGVLTGDDAWEKIRAGASLVQLYTGFVYRGPWAAAHIARELHDRVVAEGAGSLGEIVGTGAAEWAARAPR